MQKTLVTSDVPNLKGKKMYDPHEIDTLDQEEINANNIDTNKYSILQNRIMLVTFFVLLLTLNIGSIILLKHDITECQDACYKHLTEAEYDRNQNQ